MRCLGLQSPESRMRMRSRQNGAMCRYTSLARHDCDREWHSCNAVADQKRPCARRTALLAPFGANVIFELAARPAQSAISAAQEVAKDLYADAIPSPGATWGLLNRTREVPRP